MMIRPSLSTFLGALGAVALVASAGARAQQQTVQIPNPGVPQIMTLEGKFVRAAYNNEGYVILGYQTANRTIGSDWIMLDIGMTLMEKVKDQTVKRDTFSLDTPDGQVPLATLNEYREGQDTIQRLQLRRKTAKDSIDYFPPWVHGVNRLGLFADLDSKAAAWEQADVTNDRACMGQLYFKVPTLTKYGQYWLNVKLAQSVVRVPFRLFTEEEEKTLGKNFGDIKKQIDNAFRPKKS